MFNNSTISIRRLHVESQRKATHEEWNGKEKKSVDTITDLKKDIKELTSRLINHINVTDGKYSEDPCAAIRTVCNVGNT